MNSTNPSAQATAGTPATRLRDLITGFVLSPKWVWVASLQLGKLIP
jgi:hypothetical protein